MNIIAYGSLLNKQSLERTLSRKAPLAPLIIPGYRRIFNAPFGPYSFLNIEKSLNSSIETAYFSLLPQELNKFAEREAGSQLIECIPGYYAFVWPKKTTLFLPVLQSYIDICEHGARALNIDIWKNTQKPNQIINDRSHPLY